MDWLKTIDDEHILLKIEAIKKQNAFDFDKAMREGLTSEQFKAEMKKRIDTYDTRK
ncbi:hypothetical protein [Subsaximicrobium wynnwilliamsii]|uniref:hypothetical protein n=1 Tax=Subsaximicrobium wynnwilliamsii TaxID=291179 RepID=UPI0016779572|nr:hypothetical protein [Subsaximicrobium wynnwilliamsii]